MMIGETVRTAWRSLLANRMRTALTALGMIIGVGAVVAVLAIGEGARASVEGRIRSMGSNLLVIRPARSTSGAVRSGRAQTLVESDATAIKQIPGIAAVAAESEGGAQIRYRENNTSSSVTGVTPSYFAIRSLTISSGLGFTDEDGRERRRVAILGANVAETLFAGRSPLGERIQIRGIVFRVVGVLDAKGAGMSSPDDLVLVPLGTHQGVLFGGDYLSSISVQMQDESQAATVQSRIGQLLRLRHRLRDDAEDDFEVRSQTEMLETMSTITGTFTALLGSVAAVSLLVGGIGIMNIMLVSVRERTREIGVRMAVGARRIDVLLQFLVEAVVVSLFGGILGIAAGYGGAIAIAKVGGWQTIVPPYAVALSLGVSVGIGIVFGVGPARSASKLDPVEALRQE
ncbi:MAG: ABC transporter permease [Deltaproteobacteria bacterium]|nr:ABC transporter permease [Deltaproteobacteria bacterium]